MKTYTELNKKNLQLDSIYWLHPEDAENRSLAIAGLNHFSGLRNAAKLMGGGEQVNYMHITEKTPLVVFIPQKDIETNIKRTVEIASLIKEPIDTVQVTLEIMHSLKAIAVEGGLLAPFCAPPINSGTVGKYNLFRDLFIVFQLVLKTNKDFKDYLKNNTRLALKMSLKDKKGWEISSVIN